MHLLFRKLLSTAEQPPLECDHNRARAAVHAQLVEGTQQVRFHRGLGDTQVGRDALIAQTLSEPAKAPPTRGS